MQVGRDRSWSRPYTPQEDPDSLEGSGTHRGPYACLNVRNRQTDFRYAYSHRADRGGVTTMRQMGYDFVRAGDPEATGLDLPAGQSAPADTIAGMGNLMLMRIPISRYAVHAEETAQAQRESREGPTQQFLSRNEEFSRAQGGRAPRSGAAFAEPSHGRTGYRDNNSLDPNAEE